MPFDDEPDDDHGRRGPLPPDDRIWRHPSELGSGVPPIAQTRPPQGGSVPSRRTWGLVVGSALVGAALTFVALAGFGMIGNRIPIRAVEQVAVSIPGDPTPEASVGEQAYESIAAVVVSGPDSTQKNGTAVTFRSDGYLLTSADLVEGAAAVDVTLSDGTPMDAVVVGVDDQNDVAVLQVDAIDLPTATLADDSQVGLADRVMALSAGEGWPAAKEVGMGVVSGVLQRVVDGEAALHGMLQANVDLDGPAPGAVLVTSYGAVLGIVTARGLPNDDTGAVRSVANHLDLHHATPIGWAKHLADEIVSMGRADHVWVGIEGVDATDGEVSATGTRGGAKVRRVMDGSPADVAGLEEGDIVTAVDTRQISSMSELVVSLRYHDPGYVAEVEVIRDGEEMVTTVQLAEKP